MDPKEILGQLRVNVQATIFMTKAVVERMLGREHKSVVVTLSCAIGAYPLPNASIYCASKAFQQHFSESLRHEYGNGKVEFVTVSPMEVDTKIYRGSRKSK